MSDHIENKRLVDTSLEKLLHFNKITVEKAKLLPCMMRANVMAIKEMHEMHLSNNYKYKIGDVASPIIKKY